MFTLCGQNCLTTSMKTRWRILGFTMLLAGIALCGAGLWLLLNPPLYRATATIHIKAIDFSNLAVEYEYTAKHHCGWFDGCWTPATVEYIKSGRILTNVVETLHIDEMLKRQQSGSSPKIAAEELIRQHTEIVPRYTRNNNSDVVVAINVTDKNPEEAAAIANAIAKAYQDYREAERKPLITAAIQTLTQHLQADAEKIKAKQEYLEELRRQFNPPDSEAAEDLLKSNYPTYFQAKQELQNLSLIQKLTTDKIESVKAELQQPETKHSFVEIASLAQPPKSPASPNHLLGVVVIVVGVFFSCGGWQLARARRR